MSRQTSKQAIYLLVILNILSLLLVPLALFAYAATLLIPYHDSPLGHQFWLIIDFFYSFIYPIIVIVALVGFYKRRHKKSCHRRILKILVRPLLIGLPFIFLFGVQMAIG